MSNDQPTSPGPDAPAGSQTADPLSTLAQLDEGLERALALVKVARHHLGEGRTVELSALESRVSDLLELAKTLATEAPIEGQTDDTKNAMLVRLSALLDDLGELETQLHDVVTLGGAGAPHGS